MSLDVRLIAPAETHWLRQMTLRPGKPISECIFPHDDDPTTFHCGLYLNEKLICISSFIQNSHPYFQYRFPYQLRGMSTHVEYQGKGYGAKLVTFAFDELRRRNSDGVWCNARVKAIPFYERLGFITVGELFDTPHGPHKTMYKDLISR